VVMILNMLVATWSYIHLERNQDLVAGQVIHRIRHVHVPQDPVGVTVGVTVEVTVDQVDLVTHQEVTQEVEVDHGAGRQEDEDHGPKIKMLLDGAAQMMEKKEGDGML